MPPPLPRSSTVSPAFNSARAVGLPQPSDARTAALGNSPTCTWSYRSEVIGSLQHVEALPFPQQPAPLLSITLRAAWPYFARTVSLSSLSFIVFSPSTASLAPAIFEIFDFRFQRAWARRT